MSYWLPYQKEWLKDKSPIKIWEKSRRIGATYVQSFEDVEDCVTGRVKDVWFSSADETAAKEYIIYCEKWAKILNAVCNTENIEILDENKDIKALSIEFPNGARIHALTSNPTQFRSKGGKVIIDEFAHHRNPYEMWRAASPSGTVWQHPIRILSTHDDTDCLFNEFVKDCKAKRKDWSLHTTTLEDAINDGIVERINKVSNKDMTREQFIKNIKNTCPDETTWLREYFCEPRINSDLRVVKNWSHHNVRKINYLPQVITDGWTKNIDLHLTCDFNYSPNCWVLAHYDPDKQNYYFFKEYCMDMYTEDLIRVVLDDYPHPGRIIVNGDASGDSKRSQSRFTDYKLINNELIRRGYKEHKRNSYTNELPGGKTFQFDIRKGNTSRKARFAAWNSRVVDINGNHHIFADPEGCPWLIYNCEELQLIPGTSEFNIPNRGALKDNPKLKYLGHAIDNAQYMVNYYSPIKVDREERIKKELNPWGRFKKSEKK